MPGNQQAVAGFAAVHIQSHQRFGRHYDRMDAIGHEVPDWWKPLEWRAVLRAAYPAAPNGVLTGGEMQSQCRKIPQFNRTGNPYPRAAPEFMYRQA